MARGNSDLVWAGMCCWEFESRPIQIPIFLEKVAHSFTNHHEDEVGIWFYIVKTAIQVEICVAKCLKCGAFCSAIQSNLHPVPVRMRFCYPYLRHVLIPTLYTLPLLGVASLLQWLKYYIVGFDSKQVMKSLFSIPLTSTLTCYSFTLLTSFCNIEIVQVA